MENVEKEHNTMAPNKWWTNPKTDNKKIKYKLKIKLQNQFIF